MNVSLFESLSKTIISPYDELICYEYLYSRDGSSLKKMVESTVLSNKLPHEVFDEMYGMITPEDFQDIEDQVNEELGNFRVVINQTPSWPDKLSASNRPSPVLYYQGDIALLDTPNISIVGARKATDEGIQRAKKLAKELSAAHITVTTGLAAGIDTASAISALENGGQVIGVIGTPITMCYPQENIELQNAIGAHNLVVSQVPIYKYSKQPFKTKKYYFPERNELMAAISDATVIVEASDTSGTLTQARACLHQGRPLFILRSCADNSAISWPSKYIGKEGVHVLDSVDQLLYKVYGD